MALLALLSLLTLVLVILLVTAVAVHRRISIAFQILVASAAFQFGVCMRVTQPELGHVMVESSSGGLPVPFGVAIGAGLAQSALMLVVFFVTAVAVLGRLLEHGTFVAVFAFNLNMLAEQRKAGLVVVEPGRLFPAALAVAAAAIASQRFLMLVIRPVARIAISAELDAVEVAFVAISALRRTVLAAQSVFGIGVVVKG